MAYEKVPRPSTVYHLTKKEHLDSILDDGVIRRFDDTECWFCESLEKMKAYMAQTVLCEGKSYYAVGVSFVAIRSSCRRTMSFSSSLPVAMKISGTDGSRRCRPEAPRHSSVPRGSFPL